MRDLAGVKLIAFVAGGVLLLGGTLYLVRARQSDRTSTRAANESRAGEVRGVQAMGYDPASRASEGAGEEDAVAPVPAPSRAAGPDSDPAVTRRREGAPAPAPPLPPLELTEAQRAANDEYVALQAEVGAQVQAALKGKKKKLRDACWDASVGEAAFTYNLSFGADGALLAMGLGGGRNPAAGAVGQCLGAQPLDLDIAPPGKSVTVDVTVEFP